VTVNVGELRGKVSVWQKVLQGDDAAPFELNLGSEQVIEVSIFFNQNASADVDHAISLVTLTEELILGVEDSFLDMVTLGRKCVLKLFSVEYFSKFRVIDDSLVLIDELNLWRMHLKEVDLSVYLCFQLYSLFVFDLTMFQHLIYIMVFVHQQVVLGPPMLNGFTNFRESIFDL
jgi:hypothetical protein